MSWFQKCLLVSPSICCDMVWTWVFASKSLLDQSQCLLRPALCRCVFTTLSPTSMLVCVHLDTKHVRTPHPQYVFVFILRLEMVLFIQQLPLQYLCISHLNWMRHYIKLHMISTVNFSLNTAYNYFQLENNLRCKKIRQTHNTMANRKTTTGQTVINTKTLHKLWATWILLKTGMCFVNVL